MAVSFYGTGYQTGKRHAKEGRTSFLASLRIFPPDFIAGYRAAQADAMWTP